ncbi:hypothetical protein ACLMJK_008131 [Lecanora helva]
MSANTNVNGSENSPIISNYQRPKLRQATLILPKTGRRVKRNVTFGGPPGANGNESADELSPLLRRKPTETQDSSILGRWMVTLSIYMHDVWTFANSKTGKGVFKCSIAYLLGSLATFVLPVAALLGQQDGKHMVATITVYFHPARSQGSIVEAIGCAAVAFLYAVCICFSSMGVSIFFGRTLDLIVLGHIVVLIVFCGGGLGFVGWTKQRLGHPLVNISCSLTSLAIITVLTKEGAVQAAEFSDDKIVQVMKMIGMGVVATAAVSLLISPVSAKKDLRKDVSDVTDCLSELLAVITRAFLTGSEQELKRQHYLDSSDKYKKVSNSLSKNLKEAKYEHYAVGTEREYALETKLVRCLQRLAQNIGGLRSAATTQFLLLAQSGVSIPPTPSTAPSSVLTPVFSSFSSSTDGLFSASEEYEALSAIDETPEVESCTGDIDDPPPPCDAGIAPTIKSAPDIFSWFIMQLGPSMKSLAVTLQKLLDELPFDLDGRIAVNGHFRHSLEEAMELYNDSRKEALGKLYEKHNLTKHRSTEIEADFEEVAASCGYFSFSLLDFANEMKVYLEILDDLKLEVEERPDGRSWKWLRFWRRLRRRDSNQTKNDPEQESFIAQDANDIPDNIPSPPDRKAPRNAADTLDLKAGTFRYRLWVALRFFRREDVKFAIKVGGGAALYALPSFLAASRPFYQHWRGEWGLLSYMLVCAMTIGASNTTGWARFLGTCIGAVCAIVSWTMSQGNPFLLAFFGWIMALWTAYIIVAQGKGPMGRFIMLTYNLSALYAYSLSVKDLDDDDDEGGIDPIISDIVLHRVVAVLSGCLWGLIITRLIWPISARQKLKSGLSKLWLRMGLIWKRDPLTVLTEGAVANSYLDIREEFELHQFLSHLESLRSSAGAEVDLRGSFPDAVYSRILRCTGAMLDAFHAMNVMIEKNRRATKGEAEILRYTVTERAQLSTRISHLFQVLASSIKLEYPLNDALPNTEHARDRLLAKIFHFRKEEQEKVGATDEDFELLYAYALVTGQLAKEIADAGEEMEKLFGNLDEEMLQLQ